MLIRATRPTDLPKLAAVERSAAQAFTQFPSLAWLAEGEVLSEAAHRSFMAVGCSWVAEDVQGQLLGFVCASQGEQALHIEELSVRREAQGQGLGRQLLQQVIAEARRLGGRQVTLTTFADVPWNAPFYARCGFEVIADGELSARLRGLLASERAHGLTGRCAMGLLAG